MTPPAGDGDPKPALAARRNLYRGVSLGTTFVCTGAILLLNTQGAVGWGVWLDLIRLWPVFLISIGIRLIFVGTRAHLLSLAGPLLVVIAAAWAVTNQIDHDDLSREAMKDASSIDVTCPVAAETDRARVTAAFSGGDMVMLGGRTPAGAEGSGLAGAIRYAGDVPQATCQGSGVKMGYTGRQRRFQLLSPFGRWGNRWEASLTAPAPLDMTMDLAAASAEIDLRAADIEALDIEAAVSTIVLRLGPPRARAPVSIDGAMTSVRIILPEGTCYRVSRDRVFNILDADGARGRVRGARRVTASACGPAGGGAGDAAVPPAYDISYDLPFSRVAVEFDSGA